eukprot:1158480-Pelagomonas_calceolata.AAC.3
MRARASAGLMRSCENSSALKLMGGRFPEVILGSDLIYDPGIHGVSKTDCFGNARIALKIGRKMPSWTYTPKHVTASASGQLEPSV